MLLEPYLVACSLLPSVQKFQPDLILTVPDNTLSWAGYLIAKKLNLPLVTNFQDWWPVIFPRHEAPFAPVRKTLEKRFRLLDKSSVVAFCTSEGFKKFLGPHPDASVLYPCPASRTKQRPITKNPCGGKPLRVVYGGTLVRYYGQMMLSLARALEGNQEFELRLFGAHPDWSADDLHWAIEKGIYCGQLSPEDYRKELSNADIFITAMSDHPEVETMMRTSFTTKFLEYCQFAKPVIVWGPEYCEPVRVAQKEGCGLPVVGCEPFLVIEALKNLKNPEIYRRFSDAAWYAATTFFDPETIQRIFQDGVQRAFSKKCIR
jgi:glycosyltransferase involved in cell wall biosynthesis